MPRDEMKFEPVDPIEVERAFDDPPVPYDKRAVFEEEFARVFDDPLARELLTLASNADHRATVDQAWDGTRQRDPSLKEVAVVLTEDQYRRVVRSLCVLYLSKLFAAPAQHYDRQARELIDGVQKEAVAAAGLEGECIMLDIAGACGRRHACDEAPHDNDLALAAKLSPEERAQLLALFLKAKGTPS